MKTKNKVVLLALCMVALIAVSVLGTMAYLTSSDTVTNTFTVGQVTITMDEAKVNEYGVVDTNANRTDSNTYKLIPGHTYTKDPTIHVGSGSENCYLFVKVENGISGYEKSTNNIAAQLTTNGWIAVDGVSNVYVYSKDGTKEAVSAETNKIVFNNFTIADDAVVKNIPQNAEIKITAYAIQADGFESKTPAEIWTAANFN